MNDNANAAALTGVLLIIAAVAVVIGCINTFFA